MKGVVKMAEQTEKKPTTLQYACFVLSLLSLVAGAAGMVLSFIFLASATMADITAATSGFVSGSIFIGAGLISLTLLSLK